MNPDPRPSSPSQVQQLIEKWREEARANRANEFLTSAGIVSRSVEAGDTFARCADELEAALTADAASLPPKGWQPKKAEILSVIRSRVPDAAKVGQIAAILDDEED